MHEGSLDGRHVVFLSWRDTANPEGGGAERYLEKMAEGLVEHGCTVTIFCAARPAEGDPRWHPVRPARHEAVGVRRRHARTATR